MARMLKKLQSLSNVAAGSTATLELPLGSSYHQLILKYTGVTLAQLKNIRMEVNGKVFQTFKDANELNLINKHYSRGVAEDNHLVMFFARPELTTLDQQRVFALGTSDVATLTLRIDIDAAASAPKLEAHAILGNAAPIGYITKVKSFSKTFAAGGEFEIDNLPTPASARIAAIHLMSDKVTEATLEINSLKVFEATKALEAKIQKDAGRTPDASKLTLDFMKENDFAQSQVLQGVQDFRLRVQVAEAMSCNILVEYLDVQAGL